MNVGRAIEAAARRDELACPSRSRPRNRYCSWPLAGAARRADPVPAMAAARFRAMGLARGQRPRPVDLRALCQPGHDLRHPRARPSRGRRHRARLSGEGACRHHALGRRHLRRAVGALHDLDSRAHGAALGDGAGEISRHLQFRLLPDQGRNTATRRARPAADAARRAAAGESALMETAGLWMLLAVAIVLLTTGLPAYAVLVGVSALFATIGVLAGGVEYPLLTALPGRIIGLLETDLLQALPLYVLMGALLNRLPLADRLFRCGVALGRHSGGAPALATLGLGALLAPMNGSVGASVAMLSRSVAPKLEVRGVPAPQSTALVCVASTLGVVIPPSLVLILLGDAMMRAHTEAANVTKAMVRIVNTQDIFRGALVPAAMFLALCLVVAWLLGRRTPARGPAEHPTVSEWMTAAVAGVFVIGLLTGVAAGYFYAVDAAAMGGTALLLFGWASGGLRGGAFRAVLHDTMAVT